jgi:hypothetical protein
VAVAVLSGAATLAIFIQIKCGRLCSDYSTVGDHKRPLLVCGVLGLFGSLPLLHLFQSTGWPNFLLLLAMFICLAIADGGNTVLWSAFALCSDEKLEGTITGNPFRPLFYVFVPCLSSARVYLRLAH